MRITFEDHSRNVDRITNEYRSSRTEKTSRTDCYALDISGTVMDNTAYGFQGRTAEEVMQEAATQDVELLRDYMTVMSNSMSEEDFAKLQKEGYCPTNTDIETVVTIVDKIKAELAKAGVEVVGYTDTLDDETLTEIAGSESYARAIKEAFARADVPLTEQNAEDAVQAVNKASELTTPSEGAEKFMVDNHLEPTIDNIYRAEFSGADKGGRQAKGYYSEDLPGYYTKRAEQADIETLRSQIEQIITRAGLSLDENTLKNAEFLLQKGVPVTGENLKLLSKVQTLELPAEEEQLWKAVAVALAEGKSAGAANLYDGRSIYEKAAELDDQVDVLLTEAKESGNASKYRQLQEIRLMMTVEANVKLLKSGFSIDTSDLEELVDALKELEQKQAEKLFPGSENAAADYALYKESIEKTAALPEMPAAAVGKAAGRIAQTTVTELYNEGAALQKAYTEASQSYETLMTAPRKDMGDNIQTAFRNVDAILEDMGLAINAENQRAVRILGYNSMEITEANLLAVKRADRTVQRVVEKMTPAAVLKMIRDGVNPLETGFEDLENYLDHQETYEDEALKYSRYLYQLEQNKEITPVEKETYIGIYRMLRQIEKTDGGVIGRLVESGTQINFSNLLTAVRSSKVKSMNVAVDDEFGLLEQINVQGASITEQIASGYTTGLTDAWLNSSSRSERAAQFDQEILKEIRQMDQVSDSDIEYLKQLELPVTVDHLLAAATLRQDRGSMTRRIWQQREKLEQIPEALEQIDSWEDGLTDRESAQKMYTEYTEQLAVAAEELTFNAESSSLNVRAMQLTHKQLYIAGAAARTEEYDIPAVIGEDMTAIHLTLRHEENAGGKVSISMEYGEYGNITASFTMQEQKVTGYVNVTGHVNVTGYVNVTGCVTVETDLAQQKLQDVEEAMRSDMEASGIKVTSVATVRRSKGNRIENSSRKAGESLQPEMPDRAEQSRTADTGDLYQLAKSYIRILKQTFV